MRWWDIGSGLKAQVRQSLQKQGYEITEEAKLLGQSGIEHTFELLAQKDDGFTTHTIAFCFVSRGADPQVEVEAIFGFANKAYDTGISTRVVIAIPWLSQKAKQFAQKQRVKVIDGEQITVLLESKPVPSLRPKEPIKFETREQLVESLVNLGYRVEENAKMRGGSGIMYTFDIVANNNGVIDQLSRCLAVDFITGEDEVSLEELSLFDTRAYDVAIDNKVVVVSSWLSDEARQFAQHRRIKVFELGERPVADILTEEKPAPPEEEPAKAEEKVEVLGAELGEKPVADIVTEEKPALPKKEPAKAEEKSEALVVTGPSRKHLTRHEFQPEALRLIPEVIARRHNAIPLAISNNTLEVAMADPTDIAAIDTLSAISRMRIKPIGAYAKEIREAIDFNYKAYGEIEKQLAQIAIPNGATAEKLAESAIADAPLAQALNLIIEEAVKARSSDIHIEPEETRLRVRYRIDGILHDLMSLPPNIHLALISRLKILAGMNIADRLRPQDGQFTFKTMGRNIDVRVATIPTVTGETAALRLLDTSVAMLELSEIGMLPDCLEKYEAVLKLPYGMILTSGPTGSGKTTTLYASINSLDFVGRNIITIEDPAEYRFKDINQIQVNPQAGITFASGLRSILRLDPDVIMVGEIRDAETAHIAVQAALTGHLMLSSVHANDSVSVLTRLTDLGIEPFLVASAVIGVLAQRMVRRVCVDCSHPVEVPPIEHMAYEKEMGEKKTEFLYGTGCKSCAYTGYSGRTVLFEVLTMSDNIRELVTERANSSQIRAQALKEGMITMMNDGMNKVKMGITTPSEVLRSAYFTE